MHAQPAVRDVAIDALYQYVDESIDERNVTLALLHKYKHRCEWFRRKRLVASATDGLEGTTGERALAIDLYEYLHDRGVDFHVEPASASGRADIVSERVRGTRLVADAKWIAAGASPAEVEKTIVKGFSQVFSYLRDYEEPNGYLAIFNGSDIVPEIEAAMHDGFACASVATRAVYYVIIDLHDHDETASKRPPPRTVRVSLAGLIDATSST